MIGGLERGWHEPRLDQPREIIWRNRNSLQERSPTARRRWLRGIDGPLHRLCRGPGKREMRCELPKKRVEVIRGRRFFQTLIDGAKTNLDPLRGVRGVLTVELRAVSIRQ